MFEDEAGFYSKPARATTWGAVGKTPVMRIAGRGWTKINAIGTLTLSPGGRGGTRRRAGQFFKLYEQNIDGPIFAQYLTELLRAVRGPTTMVWDGLKVHSAKEVRAVLANNPRVHVYVLPAYAPELNPVETMWANTKSVKLRGIAAEDIDDLDAKTYVALDEIGDSQQLLKSFFAGTPRIIPGVAT